MSAYPLGPVVPTKFWHKLDDERVQCDVCPNRCKLKNGQRGRCFVRAAENGQVVLTTYGRSSGFCIDPIEKKPLNQFLPGTAILSFGTAGCNLTCLFCQNWNISRSREVETLADEASPHVIARAAESLGCRSVAFTYNDPAVFLEYAVDVAKECHKRNIKTVAVTAGYICKGAREELFEHMDAANVDIKGFTGDFYRKFCGGDLQTVLDTLRLSQATDQRLVRADDPAHSRRERFARRTELPVPLGGGESGAGRPGPFHGVSPRMEADQQTADAFESAGGRPPYRHEKRIALCLHRQCS